MASKTISRTGTAARRMSAWQLPSVALLSLTMAACGGGGSGDGSAGTPATGGSSGGTSGGGVVSKGNLVVTVTDPVGQPAGGVRVQVYGLETGGNFRAVTGPDGRAELTVPAGRLGVFAVAPEFNGGRPEVQLGQGQTLNLVIATQPRTERPAGGIADASVEAVSADGRILEIWLNFFPVNGYNGYETFAPRAYKARIEDCAPDAGNDLPSPRADCVAGQDGFDAAYAGAVASDIPEPWLNSPAGAANPFDTLLLMDQSAALATGDPTDRRLFAAKYLLSLTGDADGGQHRVGLGAFAADDPASGRYGALPQKPLTLFPLENPVFTRDARSFFPVVDSLASLEGGAGALLSAVDKALDFTAANAEVARRAIVVVSNGGDDSCGSRADCDQRREAVIAKSRALGARIVTIGLAGDGTADQHGSVTRLALSNWGGAAMWLDEPSQFLAAMADAHSILAGRKPTEYAFFRIQSPTAGTFVSGRTVLGKLRFEDCPWDCYDVTVPFAVKIP